MSFEFKLNIDEILIDLVIAVVDVNQVGHGHGGKLLRAGRKSFSIAARPKARLLNYDNILSLNAKPRSRFSRSFWGDAP